MIWSIPSNKQDIIVNTPIGQKSIRYLYFENKNSGLFAYKTVPDSISIFVDGKQICRDLVMLPFCTTAPNGVRRHNWRDVAIELPMNINCSEVKISGVRNNDFNIVFVLSPDAVDESKGFDYYESRVFTLLNRQTLKDNTRAVMHTDCRTIRSNEEFTFSLEYAPKGMFAYIALLDTEVADCDFPRKIVHNSFCPDFYLTIAATDNETLPTNTHLSVLSTTDFIPHSKAYWELGDDTHKTITMKIVAPTKRNIINQQVIFFFKSKQIL